MLKKIAVAAFAAVALAAFAQNDNSTTTTTNTTTRSGNWHRNHWNGWKYNTYNIGNTDISTLNTYDMRQIVNREARWIPAGDRYDLMTFLDRAPSDEETVVLTALVNNFKQASMVRDEVAMSRFGTPTDYAWLSQPALEWSSTPGQNTWTTTTTDTTATTDTAGDTTSTTTTNTVTSGTTGAMAMDNDGSSNDIAMTDDSSRPLRIEMRRHAPREIDYVTALNILDTGLTQQQQGTLHQTFMPRLSNPMMTYTHQDALDAIVEMVESNASMVDNINRWSWWNHYTMSHRGMPNG